MLSPNQRNDVLLQIIFPLAAFLDKNGFDEKNILPGSYSLYRNKKN